MMFLLESRCVKYLPGDEAAPDSGQRGVQLDLKEDLRDVQSINICNIVDRQFCEYMSYVKDTQADKIKIHLRNNLLSISLHNNQNYIGILNCYNTCKYWGLIDPGNGVYDLIDNRVNMLKEHYADFIWLYKRLSDYRSKKTFLGIINNWATFNMSSLDSIIERVFPHYFDIDLIKCDENEVLVDLGAYTGDTVASYITTYEKYKKIYCYEIVPHLFQHLKDKLRVFPNIEIRQKGVSNQSGTMYISDAEPHDSMHKLTDKGQMQIQTVSLDDDITEQVTFIKMDIEGGEQNALLGCRKHIQAGHPKLVISVYHNNEDIWKCARIIDEFDPTYKFYLRYSGGNYYPSEYVLYGI